MDRVREAVELLPLQDVTGAGVTVAVLDTGVDTEHPDLRGRLDLKESAVFTLDGELSDPHGHGTHVAGIIAGSGAVDSRFRGVAPGVRLIACKVLSARGRAHGSIVAKAIVYAADAGADIVNLSVGRAAYEIAKGPAPWVWSTHNSITDAAVVYAATKGVLCVCAAGNGGPNRASVELPGALEEALSVGYLGRDGTLANNSARGPFYRTPGLAAGDVEHTDGVRPAFDAMPYIKPDLVVPGGSNYSLADAYVSLGIDVDGVVASRSRRAAMRPVSALDSDLHYARCSGTSQAAAVCSGLAALTIEFARRVGLDLGRSPGLALANLLRASADREGLGGDVDCGYGRLTWRRI